MRDFEEFENVIKFSFGGQVWLLDPLQARALMVGDKGDWYRTAQLKRGNAFSVAGRILTVQLLWDGPGLTEITVWAIESQKPIDPLPKQE